MKIEVSNGELIDKITILWIKSQKIKSNEKIRNIRKEYELLRRVMLSINISEDTPEYQDLLKVNQKLWEIEDQIRGKERKKEFDDEFIQLARSVYFENDKRFALKRRINLMSNSELIEEKEYINYE